MAKTVSIAGKLALPQEDGGATAPYALDMSFTYVKRAEFNQSYDSTVTDDAISLGTMSTGGAKLLLIKASVGGCTFKINGVALVIPIPVGAYFLYVNPTTGFITGLTVSVAGPAQISILALA